MVFSSDHMHSWEVVDLHVRLQHGQSFRVNACIRPEQIEVSLFKILSN